MAQSLIIPMLGDVHTTFNCWERHDGRYKDSCHGMDDQTTTAHTGWSENGVAPKVNHFVTYHHFPILKQQFAGIHPIFGTDPNIIYCR